MELTKVTYSIPESAKLLGISRNSAYEAARRGEIPTITFGKRKVVPAEALRLLLQRAEPPSEAKASVRITQKEMIANLSAEVLSIRSELQALQQEHESALNSYRGALDVAETVVTANTLMRKRICDVCTGFEAAHHDDPQVMNLIGDILAAFEVTHEPA